MNLDSPGRRTEIEAALLEYHRSPGKYSATARQPALLFSCLTDVLQLAGGRSPDGALDQPPVEPVRQAACFFVRTSLLHPRVDHYALLGLDRSAESAAIKDRYRLFMRLIHPDFSGAAESAHWPTDAAIRVNKAHEVLLSQTRRRLYDEKLNETARQAPHGRTDHKPSPPPPPAGNPRLTLKALAMVFGGLGTVAVVAVLFTGGTGGKEELVQRPVAKATTTDSATVPETAPMAADTAQVVDSSSAAVVPTDDTAGAAESGQGSAPPIEPGPRTGQSESRTVMGPAPPVATQPAATTNATGSAMPAVPGLAPTARPPETAPLLPASAALRSVPAAAPDPAQKSTSIPSRPSQSTVAQAATTGTMTMPQLTPANPSKNPVPTLEEAHPLLSKLLQQMESGWGDWVLSVPDREARNTPAAQAFRRQYDRLVDGGRPVTVSHVQFTAEKLEDRLLVTGHVTLQIGNITTAATGKDLSVQAEFARRDGVVVMTKLSAGPGAAGEGAK